MTSERIAALRRTVLFGSLGEEELRALSRLNQDGLILIDNRCVTIPDEELLSAYAGDN